MAATELLTIQGSDNYPTLPDNPGRDLNRKLYDEWDAKVGGAKKEYDSPRLRYSITDLISTRHCSNYSWMSMLAVHPAYWKKGHGTELVEWGKSLSDLDKVRQGLIAADMSEKLCKKLGYHLVCRIAAEGDEVDSKGV